LPRPNEADKPRNLVLDWKKGTMLSDALRQTLQAGFPGVTANINISSQLVAPQDNIGYYGTLRELEAYLRPLSFQILTGKKDYTGVGCCLQQGEIDVHDGTSPPGAVKIEFTELIGQPTWIAFSIQVKVVMRAGGWRPNYASANPHCYNRGRPEGVKHSADVPGNISD
jgi:hypothetical protein